MTAPRRRRVRALACGAIAVLALACVTGCATLPASTPAGTTAPAPAPASTPSAQAPHNAPAAPAPRVAVVDTTPSREAVAVLGSIPEPLAANERVPAPRIVRPMNPADSTASDSARDAHFPGTVPDSAASDSGPRDVPVPSPTVPLGDRPGTSPSSMMDTTTTASPPPASAPAIPPSSPAPAAASDTCWRVQFAAPAERLKADRYLTAAQSQLLVPMVIEKERGLFKVRTRDCWDRAAADALKRRAIDAGFAGAFRFVGKHP